MVKKIEIKPETNEMSPFKNKRDLLKSENNTEDVVLIVCGDTGVTTLQVIIIVHFRMVPWQYHGLFNTSAWITVT